jgi:hypothetical protein
VLIAVTTRTFLLAVGGPLELIGIALIALDIIAPSMREALGAAIRTKQRVLERIQAAFAHLRGQLHTVVARAEMPFEVTESAAVVKKPGDDSSAEEKLELLIEVSIETQERLHRVESQVVALRDQIQRGIDDVGRQFELAIEKAVGESERAYLRWRAVGFVLALAGATAVFVASMM